MEEGGRGGWASQGCTHNRVGPYWGRYNLNPLLVPRSLAGHILSRTPVYLSRSGALQRAPLTHGTSLGRDNLNPLLDPRAMAGHILSRTPVYLSRSAAWLHIATTR